MTRFTETPQWKNGSEVADFLDRFFQARGWQIGPTSREEERIRYLGDRHYRQGDQHYYVEYKSGLQTAHTGNVFLETISVDRAGKAGWVYTCQADYIFYAALLNHTILVFEPPTLRARIELLKGIFPQTRTRHQQNKGYHTHGVMVPLTYAEQHLARPVIDTREAA